MCRACTGTATALLARATLVMATCSDFRCSDAPAHLSAHKHTYAYTCTYTALHRPAGCERAAPSGGACVGCTVDAHADAPS